MNIKIIIVLCLFAVSLSVYAAPRQKNTSKNRTSVVPHRKPETSTMQAPKSIEVQVQWHLKEAETLWNNGDRIGALVHWKEVLRLDSTNATAARWIKAIIVVDANASVTEPVKSIQPSPVPTVKQSEDAVIADVKDTLLRYSKAKGLSELADVLDDKVADKIAAQLLCSYRLAIEDVDGHIQDTDSSSVASGNRMGDAAGSPDPQLCPDFENFIDDYGLGQIINSYDLMRNVDIYPQERRPYGRKLLKLISKWVLRAKDSRIEMRLVAPVRINKIAYSLDQAEFTVIKPDTVYIYGLTVGDGVRLAAFLQDGKWRIGAQPEYLLDYYVEPELFSHPARRGLRR